MSNKMQELQEKLTKAAEEGRRCSPGQGVEFEKIGAELASKVARMNDLGAQEIDDLCRDVDTYVGRVSRAPKQSLECGHETQ